ncbi:MAG: hypothetical protein H7Y86_09695 [Rhizobacter sp.]|nr:hypothetical protein [Ferruginibacter sp.]
MEKYMLIFRNNPAIFQQAAPETIQQNIQQWMQWMGQLGASGTLVGADQLQFGGKVVSTSKKSVTDGPFLETKELVGGYIIIHAENLDKATDVAGDCPALNFEGSVEVRPIQVQG